MISYNIGYSDGDHTNAVSYTVEDEITLSAASKLGYTFEGWYAEETFDSKVTHITKGSVGDTAFYAKFNSIEYTITFNVDGGSHENVTIYTVEQGIDLNDASKAGYSFEGWYTEENFENKIEMISEGTTGDLSLFAKWSVISSVSRGNQATLSMFPNPAADQVQLEFSNASKRDISIHDTQGKVLYQRTIVGHSVKIMLDQPAGVYFVRVKEEGNTQQYKMVVE